MVFAKVTYLSGRYFGGVDDPTDPTNEIFQDPIRNEIKKNLENATIVSSGSSLTVSITLLSDEFLGIATGPDDKLDPTPMKWLYFIIYGNLENDLYWVPKDQAAKLSKGNYLGRFGEGFLVKGKEYEGRFERHPQSGQGGVPDLFQSILTEAFVKSDIIDPAVEAAVAIVLSK